MNFPIPRRCAQCGEVFPWQKLWGLSWSNENWPCPGCGAMLKWTYALFRPDVNPMVTFSVCYVRTDMLGIFIRALDVEPA